MIVLRKTFSKSKETIEERAARRQYALRHNARVSREYGDAMRKVEEEYKGKLPDRTEDWNKYNSKVEDIVKNAQATRMDSLRAAKDTAKEILGAAGYALGPRKVLDTHYDGEKTTVSVKDRSLRDRISDLKGGTSDIKERYSNNKEGHRMARGVKLAEKTVKLPEQSDIEKEYQEKLDKVSKKYNPRFIKP